MTARTLVPALLLAALIIPGCAPSSPDSGSTAASEVADSEATAPAAATPAPLTMPDADLSGVEERLRDAVAALLAVTGDGPMRLVEAEHSMTGVVGETYWYVFESEANRYEITISPVDNIGCYMDTMRKADPHASRGSESVERGFYVRGGDIEALFGLTMPTPGQTAIVERLARTIEPGFSFAATTFHDDLATSSVGDWSADRQTLVYALKTRPEAVRIEYFGKNTQLASVQVVFDGDRVATAGLHYAE